METENECAICYEPLREKNNCVTPCGHKFCFSCIATSLNFANTCPYCRTEIAEGDDYDEEEDEYEEDEYEEEEIESAPGPVYPFVPGYFRNHNEDRNIRIDPQESSFSYSTNYPVLDEVEEKASELGITLKDCIRRLCFNHARVVTNEEYTSGFDYDTAFNVNADKFDTLIKYFQDRTEEFLRNVNGPMRFEPRDQNLSIIERTEEFDEDIYDEEMEELYGYMNRLFEEQDDQEEFDEEEHLSLLETVNNGYWKQVKNFHELLEMKAEDFKTDEVLEEITILGEVLKQKENNKNINKREGYVLYPELKRYVPTFTVDDKFYDRLLDI